MKETVLCCGFKLECNRFVGGVSSREDFEKRCFCFGEQAVRNYMKGAALEISGFLEVFDAQSDYEIRPIFALDSQPGPPVAKDVFDLATETIVTAIRECKEAARAAGEDPAKAPRAILLAMHGAMVAEGHEDAEGDFLETVRREAGAECTIFATLDLHANISKKKAKNADALFPCEFYPHTDFKENALKAAQCLLDTLHGHVRPVMAIRQLPMLFPYMPTGLACFLPFREKIAELNRSAGLLNVRFAHGFFASDVEECGAAVVVVADGDYALAQETADALAEEIYEKRATFYRDFWKPEEAVREAERLLASGVKPPIVLAEVADNPGSGATADCARLLEAMIACETPSMFGLICDPKAVKDIYRAGAGNTVELALGGKTLPEQTGGPIHVQAKVLQLSEGTYRNKGGYAHNAIQRLGDAALIAVGAVQVVVSSFRIQPADRALFHLFGLEPESCPIVAVKSAVHYRASYESVAGAILEVETPGLGRMDPRAFRFERAPQSFYPLCGEKATER